MFVQTTTLLLALATYLTQALPRNVELCPSIGHYLLPDESDCAKFYYCEYGHRRRDVSTCAPGTVFSVKNQVCVHPSASNCKLPNPIDPDDVTNQNVEDDDQTYPFQLDDRFSPDISIVEELEVIPIDVYPNGCPVSRNVHKLEPHESKCDWFYQCADGRREMRACAPGTYFNPNKKICDLPSNVNCIISDHTLNLSQQGDNTNADDTQSEDDHNQPEDDIFIDFENSNANYNNNLENTVNNQHNEEEEDDIIINFENYNDNTNLEDTVSNFVNNNNNIAGHYYNNDEERDRVIINFENYNTNTDPEETVNKFEENNNDNTLEHYHNNEDTDDVIINFENYNTNTDPEVTVNKFEEHDEEVEINELKNGCPSDFSIHHTEPHETDCDKYYLCNFGKRILRECGPGNWYDENLMICTWPHLASCANSKSPKNERTLNKRWNQWRNW